MFNTVTGIYEILLILTKNDTDLLNFSNPDWISPRRKNSSEEERWETTFTPAKMDSNGIIYFSDSNDPNYLMSFVASRVKVKKTAGPEKLFFDFVGKEKKLLHVRIVLNKLLMFWKYFSGGFYDYDKAKVGQDGWSSTYIGVYALTGRKIIHSSDSEAVFAKFSLLIDDTSPEYNYATPESCTYQCNGADQNGRVYFAARRLKSNYYKCKCLSRDLSVILGNVENQTSNPLFSTICDTGPQVALADANTALLEYLTTSTDELKTPAVPSNTTIINICNANRTINVITVYMAYFLGLNINTIVNSYVYYPTVTYTYPNKYFQNTQIPNKLTNFPNLEQAFWTIVNQVAICIFKSYIYDS